jgi:hypothetical protein
VVSTAGAAIAVAAFVVFGLVGWLVARWLDRRRRVDGASGAYALTGVPASDLDGLVADDALALVRRWRALSPRASVQIAIVPLGEGLEPLAADAAAWLGELCGQGGAPGQGRDGAEGVSLVTGGLPAGGGEAGALTLGSDVVVLLARSGTRERELVNGAGRLERAGHRPDWILVTDSPKKSRRRLAQERANGGQPVETEDAAQEP